MKMKVIPPRLEKAFKDEYQKVLDHRKDCMHWNVEFCLACFGGGLNAFWKRVMQRAGYYAD